MMAFIGNLTDARSPLHLIPYPKQCHRIDGELHFGAIPPRIQAPDDAALRDTLTEVISLISASPLIGFGSNGHRGGGNMQFIALRMREGGDECQSDQGNCRVIFRQNHQGASAYQRDYFG